MDFIKAGQFLIIKRRLNSIVIYNIMNDDRNIIIENKISFPGIPSWRNNDNLIIMNGGKKLKINFNQHQKMNQLIPQVK